MQVSNPIHRCINVMVIREELSVLTFIIDIFLFLVKSNSQDFCKFRPKYLESLRLKGIFEANFIIG